MPKTAEAGFGGAAIIEMSHEIAGSTGSPAVRNECSAGILDKLGAKCQRFVSKLGSGCGGAGEESVAHQIIEFFRMLLFG
jgi:hypothetical protein